MGGREVWSTSIGRGSQTSNAHFLGEPWWRGESPSFLNYGRDARGTSVAPWGTTSLSHPYRHLISLITFRLPFLRADVLSVICAGPLSRVLVSCFVPAVSSSRLPTVPNVTVTLSPSPTLSHTPSTRAHYEFAKPKNDKWIGNARRGTSRANTRSPRAVASVSLRIPPP